MLTKQTMGIGKDSEDALAVTKWKLPGQVIFSRYVNLTSGKSNWRFWWQMFWYDHMASKTKSTRDPVETTFQR